jgi:protein TonB
LIKPVKSIQQNRTLSIAILLSLLVHGLLLAIRFTAPDAFKFEQSDAGLEVILVNSRHDRAPLKAEAIAQANLDGGGNAESGRARSPLPDMRRTEDGDALKARQRRIEQLEAQQRMLQQSDSKKSPPLPMARELPRPVEQAPRADGRDETDSSSEILRREAEIHKSIEDYNKRPRKTVISPSTREAGYAMYYNAIRERIEKFGTLNFPQKDGKKLYGELVLSIPLYQDGTIYEKEGGLTVDRSSGNPALDEAAKRIVMRSAPFGKFPPNMRSSDKDDVWVLVTSFRFTRDGVETALRTN